MSEEDPHQDTFNKKYLANYSFGYALPSAEDVAEDTMNVHKYIGTVDYIETPTYPDMPRTGTIWYKLVIPNFDSTVWKLNLYTSGTPHDRHNGHYPDPASKEDDGFYYRGRNRELRRRIHRVLRYRRRSTLINLMSKSK